MTVFADKYHDYRVMVVDLNSERIAAWRSVQPLIYEPSLDEIVRQNREHNLFLAPM